MAVLQPKHYSAFRLPALIPKINPSPPKSTRIILWTRLKTKSGWLMAKLMIVFCAPCMIGAIDKPTTKPIIKRYTKAEEPLSFLCEGN